MGRTNVLNERRPITCRNNAQYMQEPEAVDVVIVDVTIIVMLVTE